MANPTSTQVPSDVGQTAEVQGYFTPIPIPLPNPDAPAPLPQTLPPRVLDFAHALRTSTVPHPIPPIPSVR